MEAIVFKHCYGSHVHPIRIETQTGESKRNKSEHQAQPHKKHFHRNRRVIISRPNNTNRYQTQSEKSCFICIQASHIGDYFSHYLFPFFSKNTNNQSCYYNISNNTLYENKQLSKISYLPTIIIFFSPFITSPSFQS